uniref:Uncharacterized protein n=1 Tax=Rhizophora mucronata TaxID=61149 RepID=A0A2P2N100_RHIMU
MQLRLMQHANYVFHLSLGTCFVVTSLDCNDRRSNQGNFYLQS